MMNAFSMVKKVINKNCQIGGCLLNISGIISRGNNIYLFFFRIVLFVCFLLTKFLFLCCEQILWEVTQGLLW